MGWLWRRLKHLQQRSQQCPIPQPGACSADLVGAGARAQHKRAHAELLLVVLHPFAGRADGDVEPLPMHLQGDGRHVCTVSPPHQGETSPGFVQSQNILDAGRNWEVMMRGAEARAAAGFGKCISTEHNFPWFPDYEAGLEASGCHPPMCTSETQIWAHMQGCMKPGRGQGTLWGISQAPCILAC